MLNFSYFTDSKDQINEQLWQLYHQPDTFKPLKTLDKSKFSLRNIIKEIGTGCSPCPDIVTEKFGKTPSLFFITPFYNQVHKYMGVKFNRSLSSWEDYASLFFKKLIYDKIGVYDRLYKIFNITSNHFNRDFDYCFSSLVKTVLTNENNNANGLSNHPSFIKYFEKYESCFLVNRLITIENTCIIFTFSENCTFFTLVYLGLEKKPFNISNIPKNIEVFYKHERLHDLTFRSHLSKDKPNIKVSFNGTDKKTYSNSICFKSIFKVKNQEIFIIPLPNPSTANNRYWPKTVWNTLISLLSKINL